VATFASIPQQRPNGGFDIVSADDHLVWRRPWLDGLTTLASVAGSAGGMKLATSVALPAVRHPVVLAKSGDDLLGQHAQGSDRLGQPLEIFSEEVRPHLRQASG
jgi:hypothetical protein